MYLSNKTNMASRSYRNALGDLDPPPELLEEVAELVKRIEACLRETPFDDLVDRLTNRDDDLEFPAGGGVPINVIPGAHKLACTALTLALAKGISAGSRLGFPNVMRTVRAYLIDCERIAKSRGASHRHVEPEAHRRALARYLRSRPAGQVRGSTHRYW